LAANFLEAVMDVPAMVRKKRLDDFIGVVVAYER